MPFCSRQLIGNLYTAVTFFDVNIDFDAIQQSHIYSDFHSVRTQ